MCVMFVVNEGNLVQELLFLRVGVKLFIDVEVSLLFKKRR